MLAQTPKHYYSYNEEYEKLRLVEYIGITKDEVEKILEDMASTGKIDFNLWHKHKVIISRDFIDSLADAYRRRSADKPTFETIMEEICRQYDGNMTETCHINKIKEKKRKEKKRKENSDSDESPDVSGKAKKLPLRERDPVNDMERVEKAYLRNWDYLYSHGKVKALNPVVNWNQTRKLLKTHFENIPPELIIQAVNNGLNDEWILNCGYSLGTILSAAVLNRLINADTSGTSKHRIGADNVSKDKAPNFFREANV
jgi:hypothetical protein